jgi:hypothetical protein
MSDGLIYTDTTTYCDKCEKDVLAIHWEHHLGTHNWVEMTYDPEE